VARRYLPFPLRATDRQLVVAGANPTDLDAEPAARSGSGTLKIARQRRA
jgi:hypothetical protein